MKNKTDLLEQQIIVDSYIIHNTNSSQKLNYKKTSHIWAMEISKWAGVQISIQAVDNVCQKYSIRTVEISKGVNVYGLQTIK
jgi:hypothetical protein